MNVRNLLTHNTIIEKVLINKMIYKMINKMPTSLVKNTTNIHLGRWSVEYNTITLNRKIDFANNDNNLSFTYKNELVKENIKENDEDKQNDEYLKYMF
jgi:hypothetical protein